ncbi:unnamed protein product [Phytomonas sp. Hart1]|nr:unnamed protein product [Phytomonas sp. Hart1]|eukprot:CCW72159.1 unnamed protein product [Phytomonas sp. isolate Hart1]
MIKVLMLCLQNNPPKSQILVSRTPNAITTMWSQRPHTMWQHPWCGMRSFSRIQSARLPQASCAHTTGLLSRVCPTATKQVFSRIETILAQRCE